ncbi:chromatin protein Cren7 [Pyrobaculum sp. 3827-6]|uniref:chromatin protein Cren7 n=1 Tax=Pyrobaculum TaxID=2276 RepID=UPI0011E532F6|nr:MULTISPECIES: chromatin protein Cren7 [Pyrobaculum]MCU7788315.1 chromatin protein Cren7 [Pyrobaculum sp. 3827-6]
MAEEILNREYEVEWGGRVYRLRPVKAWILQPPGKPGVVVALFRLPDGRTVRRVIMRLPP